MKKIEKRLTNLQNSNSGLFFKNEALQREFKAIRFDVAKLEATNEKLEVEQASYEASLRAEIERIQLLGPWKRFWGSVELFKNLFEVIQGGFKE